jgi:hypothetical protein
VLTVDSTTAAFLEKQLMGRGAATR